MLRVKTAGFSLIEVMIVVAIVGIVVSIALPMYGQHVVRTRIVEARAQLLEQSMRLEQRFNELNRYSETSPSTCLASAPCVLSQGEAYTINLVAGETSYTLRAEATPAFQAAHPSNRCTWLALDQNNRRTFPDDATLSDCWGR